MSTLRPSAFNLPSLRGGNFLHHKERAGFTLIEFLVAFIIVSILAALTISSFTRTRERALDKEAQSGLRLIQAAEKAYSSKFGTYLACSDTTAINTNLQLDLASTSWNFSVFPADQTTFTASALRTDAGSTRTWSIIQDTTQEPACSGTCL